MAALVGASCTRPDGDRCHTACARTCAALRAIRATGSTACPCVDRMVDGVCAAAAPGLDLSGLTSPTPTPPQVIADAPVVPIPLLVVVPRAQGCRAILGAQCLACDAFRCDGTEACWCDDPEPAGAVP